MPGAAQSETGPWINRPVFESDGPVFFSWDCSAVAEDIHIRVPVGSDHSNLPDIHDMRKNPHTGQRKAARESDCA